MTSENKNERKIPQQKTKAKWQSSYPWLEFSNEGMICTLCCEWQKQIETSKNFSDRFIVGCNNYRISTIQDHGKSEMHLKSIEQKDKKMLKMLMKLIERELSTIFHKIRHCSRV